MNYQSCTVFFYIVMSSIPQITETLFATNRLKIDLDTFKILLLNSTYSKILKYYTIFPIHNNILNYNKTTKTVMLRLNI